MLSTPNRWLLRPPVGVGEVLHVCVCVLPRLIIPSATSSSDSFRVFSNLAEVHFGVTGLQIFIYFFSLICDDFFFKFGRNIFLSVSDNMI